MPTVPSSEQRLAAFRTVCKRAVEARDEKGVIPKATCIPTRYADLDDHEKATARAWLTDQVLGSVYRLDVQRARAWSDVQEHVRGYAR